MAIISKLVIAPVLLHCATLLTLSAGAAVIERASGSITPESFAQRSFDYIIVGGGTAGLVVAARLTENPQVKVGVIEAGRYHPDDPLIDDPARYGAAFGNDDYDWNFFTTPQPGLGGRLINENRGKVLGGSSALNAFAWHRPSAQEFDAWGTTFGNGELWTWKNIKPYFMKAENWTGPPPLVWPGAKKSNTLPTAHGKGGPITIGYNNYFADELSNAIAAAANLDIPLNNDPDSGNSTNFANVAHSVDPATGKRAYAAPGYYEPFKNRPNYVVLTSAEVTKINFDSGSRGSTSALKATGVTFVSNNKTYVVNTTKEVILSAGSLKSAPLLELSGVGNKTLLSGLGIKTLVDLPSVGENFFDHAISFSDSVDKPGQMTLDMLAWNATYKAEQEAIYAATHQGPLSYTSAAIGVIAARKLVPPQVLTRMKATLNSTIGHRTPLAALQYADSLQLLEAGEIGWGMIIAWPGGGQASKQANGTSYFGHHVLNYRPFSRGSVHINSTNPFASPLIDPNFFGVDFDLEFCAQELLFTQRWSATKPLSNVVAGPNVPPADQLTDKGMRAHCRNTAFSTWHPAGSTAMAPLEKGGVVSNKLMVHGLANVRIVDAGILPQTVGAALQATTYMLAEKAADIIKADNQ